MWSDRKVRLESWIVQKNRAMHSDKWEEQYTTFNAHDGMPPRGTKLFNCQMTQSSNGRAGLNAGIEKETAANEGGHVWSNRRARLVVCI